LNQEEYYNEGEEFYIEGEYEKAFSCFQKCNSIEEDFDCLNYIGCCYLGLNDLENATKTFKYLIENCPDWERPLFNLGRVYIKKEMLPEAFDCLSKAEILNPMEEDVFFYFGVYFQKICDYKNAVESYKKSLALNNFQSETQLNLAVCYAKLGMQKKALERIEFACLMDSKSTEALFNKGMILLAMKEYNKAIDTFLELYSLEPDNIDNMVDICNCYLKIEELSNAEKWINKIRLIDPNNEKARKLLMVLSVKKRMAKP
jgi:tetratricopeptide (TPR) repeat protein